MDRFQSVSLGSWQSCGIQEEYLADSRCEVSRRAWKMVQHQGSGWRRQRDKSTNFNRPRVAERANNGVK